LEEASRKILKLGVQSLATDLKTRLGWREDVWFFEIEFRSPGEIKRLAGGIAKLKTFLEIVIASLRWEITGKLIS
jgi:hypothetical protein